MQLINYINKLPNDIKLLILILYKDIFLKKIQIWWKNIFRYPYTPLNHCRYTCCCPYCIYWRITHYENKNHMIDKISCNINQVNKNIINKQFNKNKNKIINNNIINEKYCVRSIMVDNTCNYTSKYIKIILFENNLENLKINHLENNKNKLSFCYICRKHE